MTYNYEALNSITFQKLAQAIIVAAHPNTQCLPVPQPDGGRDAFHYWDQEEKSEFVVFQVKFSENPKSKEERDAIDDAIRTEKKKVEKLILKGATHFYLVTNVAGTAHPDAGSIDKANKSLSNEFGIPSFVWWRDDLDRRLDNASDIKWSFVEILRGSDVLQMLVQGDELGASNKAIVAIRAYMGRQYGDDRDVKFKQVELQRQITDLFVDLPIGTKDGQERDGHRRLFRKGDVVETYLDQLSALEEHALIGESPFDHNGRAAAFLMFMPYKVGVTRLVLEGAPGQGKSTVTQFLCQANRLKLIAGKQQELERLQAVHRQAPTRFPFRVDLRDFAEWVGGRHPQTKSTENVPGEGQRSLESFLVMQIQIFSGGGLALTQNDLLRFFRRAHAVVVLDGFDEVADTETRARLVKEICDAANRLDANETLSLQLIVTSRPAAFANSPGFPGEDWAHLELTDLGRTDIEAYQKKWAEAQNLTPAERGALSVALTEKLQQPHLRDLARNPMQLAILLQLMHVQGAALPDKRTALYDRYMDIFLNREVEKNQIVGKDRELIIALHGLLAWLLQKQAELGEGAGSITESELKKVIRDYLESEGHDVRRSDQLWQGTMERVGALVSRVQGTYEFEVQPLREYFAARHLKETTPYVPATQTVAGTLPERFGALARSQYWTNVTRFFCGFCNRGELETIVAGLTELSEAEGYAVVNHPRRLALMLLGDYVFSQAPKTMRRLVDFIMMKPAFQRLTAEDLRLTRQSLALPEEAGREILYEACVKRLDLECDPIQSRVLRLVIASNADAETRKMLWMERYTSKKMTCHPVIEAIELDVLHSFTPSEVKALSGTEDSLTLRWLWHADHYDALVEDEELYKRAEALLLDGRLFFYRRQRRAKETTPIAFEVVSEFLSPHLLAETLRVPSGGSAGNAMLRYGFRASHDILTFGTDEPSTGETGHRLDAFARFLVKHFRSDLVEWQVTLLPWSKIVDEGFRTFGSRLLFVQIAITSAGVDLSNENSYDDEHFHEPDDEEVRADEEEGSAEESDEREAPTCCWDEEGFAATEGLVERLYFARGKGSDPDWWSTRFKEYKEGSSRLTMAATLLVWGAPIVVASLAHELSRLIVELKDQDWKQLRKLVSHGTNAAGDLAPSLNEGWFDKHSALDVRLAFLLSYRVRKKEDKRLIGRHCFGTYKGNDVHVLRRAVDWEVKGGNIDAVDWAYVKRLSKLARKAGMGHLITQGRSSTLSIPFDEAIDILTHCEMHAPQLVALSERVVGHHVTENAEKVSSVAANENWFDQAAG